ncbi:hypothetical protein LPUS_11902 [Lasallia pustulata]|uniref:Uncharacterized protein n=1 Tax=Lasallia pustulata TaxID=136370 RepID=A0A1W5DDM4_9LECA|nr:hypothetical protein LPUS_11902 [Lasallia pustulata]
MIHDITSSMDNFLPQSASILRAFARETNQSDLPQPRKLHECIDSSFVILVKGHEYHQNVQDKGIKKELVRQREYMDGRFESIDEEFVKQREYMDGRFESIDKKFESIDKRDVVHNDFPTTVGDFWKLSKRNRVNKLISLVRFYGISHHQLLASEIVDSDESDDNDGPIEVQTLEEIVLSHPKRAQEALAEKLGLKYEKIAIFMERVKAFRQEAATGKRPATASYEEQWNKRRLPPPEDHRVSSSPDATSSHSDKTRIFWSQGPRLPGPVVKDTLQHHVPQPPEANPPKPSISPTAP